MTRALIIARSLLLYAAHPGPRRRGRFPRLRRGWQRQSLTFQEFTTLVGHMATSGRRIAVYVQRTGLYGIAFGRVDRNGDGLATPDELIAAQAWIEAYAARHDAARRSTAAAGSRPAQAVS
jgi:hypothetical protein